MLPLHYKSFYSSNINYNVKDCKNNAIEISSKIHQNEHDGIFPQRSDATEESDDEDDATGDQQ